MQHGPAASSGSKTKAPGLAGGYLLVCASGTLCSDRSLAFFAFPGSGLKKSTAIYTGESCSNPNAASSYRATNGSQEWDSSHICGKKFFTRLGREFSS
jgi:hypothetical protein